MEKFKVGDKIISNLDGQIYTIIKFGPRDNLEEPFLPNTKRLGNCAIVESPLRPKCLLYEWEMELLNERT